MIDLDQLLAEASDSPPCGPDLEYDPAFLELEQAYRDAKRAYDMRQSQTALLLMGFAACRLKSESKARFAHRRLRGKGKTEMESACLQKGIDLR